MDASIRQSGGVFRLFHPSSVLMAISFAAAQTKEECEEVFIAMLTSVGGGSSPTPLQGSDAIARVS